ncbi:hypothetical protein SAMN04489712_11826 [Thermomonospora echinospora]|uniref:Lasso RiPP family leader peptide-containing protein n=1 Tax=Thermomonospora echinospora TaxID=1992 RepID=A0A1H6DL16_9ACTN|nr:lasso RiPP family leader peptide-containing protein [Thermomonospora echinospora]SEG85533.1 hypothetical protein SAMN04489712_11826 [Thermomonospora echinospora]
MASALYEPPALTRIGDLREVTLGPKTWGFDYTWQCLFVGCPPN